MNERQRREQVKVKVLQHFEEVPMNTIAGYQSIEAPITGAVSEHKQWVYYLASGVFLFSVLAARITIAMQLTDVGYALQRGRDQERQLIDEERELQLEYTRLVQHAALQAKGAKVLGLTGLVDADRLITVGE